MGHQLPHPAQRAMDALARCVLPVTALLHLIQYTAVYIALRTFINCATSFMSGFPIRGKAGACLPIAGVVRRSV